MSNITLGNLSSEILFLVTLIGGIIALVVYIKKALNVVIQEQVKPINEGIEAKLVIINNDIKDIKSSIYELGINDCKNFLTIEFARLLRGEELSSDEIRWIYHNYEKYTNVYGQNSYIHEQFVKLKNLGKL